MININFFLYTSFFAAFFSGTSFKLLQVFFELLLILACVINFSKLKLSKVELFLVLVGLYTFILAFLNLVPIDFVLILKIYGVALLLIINLNHLDLEYLDERFVNIIIIFNVLLLLYQTIFGFPDIIPKWIFVDFYQNSVDRRPIGILLTPHPSSFLLVLYMLYLFNCDKSRLKKYFVLFSCFLPMSLTAPVAGISQVLFGRYKFTQFILYILIISFILIYYYNKSIIINILMFSSYTRYYSLEMLLDQVIAIKYWEEFFNIFPTNLDDVMSHYEVYYGLLGSEVGYIRTAIQTGTLYFIAVFVYLIRKLPSYSIFIIVSFFHYSYLLIMPFMIILLFYYQGKINAKMR